MKKRATSQSQLSLMDLLLQVQEEAARTPQKHKRTRTLAPPPSKMHAVDFQSTDWWDALIEYDASYNQWRMQEANEKALEKLQIWRQTGALDASGRRILSRYTGYGAIANVLKPEHYHVKDILRYTSEADYASIREATPFAFYTPPKLIRQIWKMVRQLGFEGGRILEPACGVGLFIGGMQGDVHLQSDITGIELETVAGDIARAINNQPNVTIHVQGFERTHLRPGTFDLVISNVPFGDVPVHDPQIEELAGKAATHVIHDYYFVRAMNLVRPGGLVVFLTSRFTLDKETSTVRRWLADQADLVTAWRFPNDTFARTDAVADLIVLRKREADDIPGDDSWVETGKITVRTTPYEERITTEHTFPISQYFLDHPQQILGTPIAKKGAFGYALSVAATESESVLWRRVQWSGATIYHPALFTEEEEFIPAPIGTRDGQYYQDDKGNLFRNLNGAAIEVDRPATEQARIKGQIQLVELAQATLKAAAEGDDYEWERNRHHLKVQYADYVSKHGRLNDSQNVRAFEADPRSAFARALEIRNGQSWETSQLFERKTVGRTTYPDRVESGQDALTISLARLGRVDFPYMGQLTGRDEHSLQQELAGKIFFDPALDQWVTADEYLSGNVVQKLDEARAADLGPNVIALEGVQPTPLLPDDIHASLGSTWIPASIVKQFVNELGKEDSLVNNMDTPGYKYKYYDGGNRIDVQYLPPVGQWLVGDVTADTYSLLLVDRWGTRRRNAALLVSDALNQSETTVYDVITENRQSKEVLNQAETVAAREKKFNLKVAFAKWIWLDPNRAEALAKAYNERFNTNVMPKFDGEHLSFPGLSTDFVPRGYQKNAVWRTLRTGSTYYWHIVGAGKSAEMILSVMESRRLGLRKKPMVVIPNHLLDQFAGEWYRLYPMADLLIIRTDDLSPKELQTSLSRIATGDYDAILLTQSSFIRIPVGDGLWASFITAEMNRINSHIETLKGGDYYERERNKTAIKVLERKRRTLKTQLENAIYKAKKKGEKGGLVWEQLGVDMLVCDEASSWKNLSFTTNINTPGVGGTGSTQAYDLFVKSQWTTRRCENGHLLGEDSRCSCGASKAPGMMILATGTALDNSISELYTWQRFMQMDKLIDLGLVHFDAWASQFGDTETVIEMKPSGKGWRSNTRFVRFNNVPDLIKMFGLVCDMQIDPDVLGLKRPAVEGGGPTPVECEPTEWMLEYIDECGKRAENLDPKKPEQDNILKIMSDATKAATDARLINPNNDDDPRSKINVLVRNLFDIWETSQQEGEIRTQAVFLDIGTPGGSTFNLYQDIKDKLVALGVPDKQIAFAQTAKNDREKKAMFAAVDKGDIRIIIGSTRRMGTGVNMQTHLYAIHHVDAPWTPGAIEQRDGRILRDGNRHSTVRILRYVTAKSMDFYRWHLIQLKASFIKQLATGGLTQRSVQDLENLVLSFAQMKAMATGDPRIIEQVRLEAEYTKLEAIHRQYQDQKRRLTHRLSALPSQIQYQQGHIKRLNEAIDILRGVDVLSLSVDGYKISEDKENAAMVALTERGMKTKMPVKCQVGPFTVTIKTSEHYGTQRAEIMVGPIEVVTDLVQQGAANLKRIRGVVSEVHDKLAYAAKHLIALEQELVDVQAQIKIPFTRQAELDEVRQRLIALENELHNSAEQIDTTKVDENESEHGESADLAK
jgi:N12 class adenine-specific DNA methylase